MIFLVEPVVPSEDCTMYVLYGYTLYIVFVHFEYSDSTEKHNYCELVIYCC